MVEMRRSSASSSHKRVSSSPSPSSAWNPKQSKAASVASKEERDQKEELGAAESPNLVVDSIPTSNPSKEADDVGPTEKKKVSPAQACGSLNTDQLVKQLVLPISRRGLQWKQRTGKGQPDTGNP